MSLPYRHIAKTKLLQEIHKQIPKRQEKYIKKYNFRKKYSYLSYMCVKTENICITWKISISWKKEKKFLMPLYQTDINGFKSDLYLLPYGPLEPMVINFTCNLLLVGISLRWPPPPSVNNPEAKEMTVSETPPGRTNNLQEYLDFLYCRISGTISPCVKSDVQVNAEVGDKWYLVSFKCKMSSIMYLCIR